MTVDELLAELARRGVALEARSGELRFKAPKGALTDELKAALKESKRAVIARLEADLDERGLVPVPRDGPLPLSFQQERFLLLERLEPGCGAYLVPVAARLRGPLDADALHRAAAELVRRNEVLRCVADGEIQRPLADDAFSFETRAVPADAIDAALTTELSRPVDLERGPLLRVRLWRIADEDHVLLLMTHLFCGDGWSLEHLIVQFAALYRDLSAKRRPSLSEQPLQYADFAAWQRRCAGEVFEEQIGFWERALDGVPARMRIPSDHRRPVRSSSASRRHRFTLTVETGRAVRDAAARSGATPFAVLLAGLDCLLARYCETDDVVVGTITSNRGRIETERMLGSFSNAVFLRGRVDLAAPFAAAVRSAQQQLLDAGANQDVPTELLAERFELAGARLPELQVLVIYHEGDPVELLDLGGVEVERVGIDPRGTRVDWNLALEASGETFAAELDLPTELYAAESAAIIAADYEGMLLAGAAAEGARAGDFEPRYAGTWQPPTSPAGRSPDEPRNDIERAVRDAWLAHLEVDEVGLHENFFDVGGHSLAAIEVIARLENELGVRLDVGDFMMQTLAQVAATCESRKQSAPTSEERPGMFSRMFRRRSR